MRVALLGLTICFMGGLAACSGGGDDPVEGAEDGPCRPDNSCDSGLVCLNGTCQAETECQVGARQDCYCTGGAMGTQTCQADGTWADCSCGAFCGDQTCDAGEDWITCPGDCPGSCGNQVCDPGEDEYSCPADCQASQDCDLTTGHISCDACINLNCYASCTACADDVDCTGLWTCLDTCQDSICIQNCQAQYPNGQTLLDAFAGPSGCLGVQCEVSCGNNCGNGTCDAGEDSVSCPDDCPATGDCDHLTGDEQCDACISTYCAQPCQACYANSECWALKSCLEGCGADIPCIQQCTQDHGTGNQDFNALLGPGGCVELNCTGACQ